MLRKRLFCLFLASLLVAATAIEYTAKNVPRGQLPPPLKGRVINANFFVVGGGTAAGIMAPMLAQTNCGQIVVFERAAKVNLTDPFKPFHPGMEFSDGGYYNSQNENTIRIQPNSAVDNEHNSRGNVQSTVKGGNQRLSHYAIEMGSNIIHDEAMCQPLNSPPEWCSPQLWGSTFSKIFNFSGPHISSHPSHGRIRVQESRKSVFQDEWIRSCSENTGNRVEYDFNTIGGAINTCGAEPSNLRTDGFRSISENEYLIPEAQRNPNLILIRDTYINRIIFDEFVEVGEKPRAIGVEGTFNGIFFSVFLPERVVLSPGHSCPNPQSARSYKKIILSAGTIDTAHLLLRSGVGPRANLEDVGVPVVLDQPHVGQNYKEGMVSYFGYGSNATAEEIGMYDNNTDWITSRPAGFINHPSGYKFMYLLTPSFWQGSVSVYLLIFQMEQPYSGSVSLLSANPGDQPMIIQPWNDTTVDQQVIGLLHARSILQTPTSAGYSLEERFQLYEWFPGGYPTDHDGVANAVRTGSEPILHAVGTARMSLTQADGVVDTRMRVHGISDLMVADNSIYRYFFGAGGQGWAYVAGFNAQNYIREDLGFPKL